MVNTVWGFVQLANHRVDEARAAFQTAISQDLTLGLPQLGLDWRCSGITRMPQRWRPCARPRCWSRALRFITKLSRQGVL